MDQALIRRVNERTVNSSDISILIAERLLAFENLTLLVMGVEELLKKFETLLDPNITENVKLKKVFEEVLSTLQFLVISKPSENVFKTADLTVFQKNVSGVCDHWVEFIKLENPIINKLDPNLNGLMAMLHTDLTHL
jgi:hypothetical protein